MQQKAANPAPVPNVLLVGDKEKDLEFLSGLVATLGWQSGTARDGVEAARLCSQNDFSVVIADRLSGECDWRALQAGFRHLERAPLLLLTLGWGEEDTWLEALDLGAFDVLARPFNPAEVKRQLSLAGLAWITAAQPSAATAAIGERRAPVKQYLLHHRDYAC